MCKKPEYLGIGSLVESKEKWEEVWGVWNKDCEIISEREIEEIK